MGARIAWLPCLLLRSGYWHGLWHRPDRYGSRVDGRGLCGIPRQRRPEAANELEKRTVSTLQEVRRLVAGGIEKARVKIGDQALQVVPGAVAGVGAVVPTIVGALLSLVSVETERESQAEINQSISR